MRPVLGRNVAASVLTAGTLLLSSALAVPIILHEIGTAGFGVWSFAITAVLYVTVAEGGIGPAVQRFVAVASGTRDLAEVNRLIWTSLAVYAVAGALLLGVLQLAAPSIVGALDIPGSLEADAEGTFRIIGVAILAALLVSGLGNAVQGLERFMAYGISLAAGAAVYLAGGAILLTQGEGLQGLAWAAVGQQVTMLVGRAWTLRDVMFRKPAFVNRSTAREVGSFSVRLQASVLSILVNSQTDKVVVGLVAPAATLGQVSIGAQVAESGRLVAGAALSPMISRLSVVHAGGDVAALGALFNRLNRLWILTVLGMTAIGIGSIYPLIAAWLGEGYGDAGFYGALLVLGYGVSLLPSVVIAFLRAVGRPGYEARYGLMTVALNVVGTVVLGVVAGPVGVVSATAAAYVLATAWLALRTSEALPSGSPVVPVPLRGLATTAVVGGASFAWGLAMIDLLPRGVALLPIGAGAALLFLWHLGVGTGVWPTPANVRALFA